MRIFDLQGIKNSGKFVLGINEDSGNFIRESRMRIFILLGSEKLYGEEGFLLESK